MPELESAPLVEFRDLVVSYGLLRALDGVSGSFRAGPTGLLGPNGAGKTTLLKVLLGFLEPEQGRISAFGLDPGIAPLEVRRRIGYMPEVDCHIAAMTGASFVAFAGELSGMPRDEAVSRAHEVLYYVGLGEARYRTLDTYSTGMKQRVKLAQALVHDPDLLLLDEPTTGLDPQARHLMWERLQNLLQQGKSILLTTHFMDEAERLCDRLAVLDHGRKIAEGTPRGLIREHLESDVVEVYGEGAKAMAQTHASFAERIETSGETVFFYLREPRPLLQALSSDHSIRYLHRPANLEDLFLKLTGRQIRDEA